ncbi:potassium channel subfamily K member 18-like [Anabrus simplex]|uniref:potassium channel subfamily K member 18-like n=1 Tax=Anabrus simplex TaxID=316456 RepID=UPI0035A31C55
MRFKNEECLLERRYFLLKKVVEKLKERYMERSHDRVWYNVEGIRELQCYGSIALRTALGKAVTMCYAVLGIPLMLIYLSSVGSLLSRCVRGAFTKTICCCFCSNCGYCCYDEKRMQEKERRMRKKRQQMELQQQQQQLQLQEPFYVRSSSSVTAFSTSASSTHNNLHSPVRDGEVLKLQQSGSLIGEPDYTGDTSDNDSKPSQNKKTSGSLFTPVALCLGAMVLYVCGGAVALVKLEGWPFLDGCYFCFMSLSTIGFGDLVPGGYSSKGNSTVWFCSVYILTGMALTAMCFNILHDEIVHRLKHQAPEKEDVNGADPYSSSS